MINRCLEQHGSLIEPLLNGSLDDTECIICQKQNEDSLRLSKSYSSSGNDLEESVLIDSQAIEVSVIYDKTSNCYSTS